MKGNDTSNTIIYYLNNVSNRYVLRQRHVSNWPLWTLFCGRPPLCSLQDGVCLRCMHTVLCSPLPLLLQYRGIYYIIFINEHYSLRARFASQVGNVPTTALRKIKRTLSFFIQSDEEARHRQSESRPYTSLLFCLKERYNLLPVCTVIGNAGGSCQVISSTTVV